MTHAASQLAEAASSVNRLLKARRLPRRLVTPTRFLIHPPNLSPLFTLIQIHAQMQQQALDQANAIATGAVQSFPATTETYTALIASQVANDASWYSTQEIQAWAEDTAKGVDAVAKSVAHMTDAYLASVVTWMKDLSHKVDEVHEVMRPEGAVETGDNLRQGETTHAGVYGRVADAYRWQQHRRDQHAIKLATDPNPLPPALQTPFHAALQRAQQIAAKDIQLAVRNQAAKTLGAAQDRGLIIGYRRVIHPELDRDGVCALCVAASTRIYHASQLMPLHDDCHCTPMPITADHDPGALINDEDLGTIYQQAGGTSRDALEHTHYSVVQNSETGPVLIQQGAAHRTPGMVRKSTKPRPRRPDSEATKRRQLTMLHDSLARSLKRIDDELLPADRERWTEYRQELADRVASLESQLKGAAA